MSKAIDAAEKYIQNNDKLMAEVDVKQRKRLKDLLRHYKKRFFNLNNWLLGMIDSILGEYFSEPGIFSFVNTPASYPDEPFSC